MWPVFCLAMYFGINGQLPMINIHGADHVTCDVIGFEEISNDANCSHFPRVLLRQSQHVFNMVSQSNSSNSLAHYSKTKSKTIA